MRAVVACLLVLVLPAAAWAGANSSGSGLTFEATSVDVKPEPGAGRVVAKFPFKNSSDQKVTIFAAESDCGCTTAGLDKREYAPGETGAITATFEIGSREGAQVKQIRVRASDQSEPHLLTLKTNIPVFAKLQPAFVYWANGEPPAPKSILLELIDTTTPIAKLTAKSNNPAITPEIREIEKGRKFEIVVKPGATEKFLLATIQLMADTGNGKPPRLLQAYATIKP